MRLSTAQGALSYAAAQRDHYTAEWQRLRRLDFNGQAYGAFLFLTHDIDASDPVPTNWTTGKKLDKPIVYPCRLPRLLPRVASDAFDQHVAQKNLFAKVLSEFSRIGKAAGVLFVAEAWMAPAKAEGRSVEEVRATMARDLADEPGRSEGLIMLLEHRELPQPRMWAAQITREPDRLAPWREMPNPDAEHSRFLGFIEGWRS